MGQKHKKIQAQFHAEMMTFIETGNDLSTVALKGQLYAEYWLNEAMLAAWGDKASELVNQFAFAKKITIVKATGLIDNVPLLETLIALSEIRNGMAHNLVPENPLALVKKLPRFPDDAIMREFLPDRFSDENEWALVYLKVSVIVACIPLILHYYVPKKGQTDSGEWALRLKQIALDKLRPKAMGQSANS
jgi:hypothetical protein